MSLGVGVVVRHGHIDVVLAVRVILKEKHGIEFGFHSREKRGLSGYVVCKCITLLDTWNVMMDTQKDIDIQL